MKKMTIRKMLEKIVIETSKRNVKKIYDEYLKNQEMFETKDKEEEQNEQDLLDFLQNL